MLLFPDLFLTGVDGAGGMERELFGMPLRFSVGILKSAPDSPRRPSVSAIPLESGS